MPKAAEVVQKNAVLTGNDLILEVPNALTVNHSTPNSGASSSDKVHVKNVLTGDSIALCCSCSEKVKQLQHQDEQLAPVKAAAQVKQFTSSVTTRSPIKTRSRKKQQKELTEEDNNQQSPSQEEGVDLVEQLGDDLVEDSDGEERAIKAAKTVKKVVQIGGEAVQEVDDAPFLVDETLMDDSNGEEAVEDGPEEDEEAVDGPEKLDKKKTKPGKKPPVKNTIQPVQQQQLDDSRGDDDAEPSSKSTGTASPHDDAVDEKNRRLLKETEDSFRQEEMDKAIALSLAREDDDLGDEQSVARVLDLMLGEQGSEPELIELEPGEVQAGQEPEDVQAGQQQQEGHPMAMAPQQKKQNASGLTPADLQAMEEEAEQPRQFPPEELEDSSDSATQRGNRFWDLKPWNVDTIGKEAWSKSIITKQDLQEALKELDKVEEKKQRQRLEYYRDNDKLLKKLALLEGFDRMEEHMLEHPHLVSKFATDWLTIEALDYAIEENETKMGRAAENCITIQFLLALAKSLNALATNTNGIKNFFNRIRSAEQLYTKLHQDEVNAFKKRLRKHAKDKQKDEAIAQKEAQEKVKRIAASPGGLDWLEVLEGLPEELREVFESQSMDKMFQVADRMDQEVFQHHLQRCIDSGLWIPNTKEQEGEKEHEESAEEGKEQEEREKSQEGNK